MPEFVKLLRTTDDSMLGNYCIRCLLCITNEIGNRASVLAKEIIPALVKWSEFCLNENRDDAGSADTVPEGITWRILSLYPNLLAPENNGIDIAVLDFLPALTRILTESRHGNTFAVGCEAFSSLVNAIEVFNLAISELGACNCLLQLMNDTDPKVVKIALSATPMFSNQSQVCKDKVLECGVLPKLVNCLKGSPDRNTFCSVYKLICNLSQIPVHIHHLIDAQLILGLIKATKREVVQVRLKAN